MKRLFIILAACTLLVSCRWWHETFSSPERCARWYCDEMLEALQDGDITELMDLKEHALDWYYGLSESDKERAASVIEPWLSAHEEEIKRYIPY